MEIDMQYECCMGMLWEKKPYSGYCKGVEIQKSRKIWTFHKTLLARIRILFTNNSWDTLRQMADSMI